ncbi:MAG: flagellar biosynthesis protein FlhF, partial [Thermicanus sp.]|nr:flagellar biosynthesis protein FlhF [Thermicanus sp.]
KPLYTHLIKQEVEEELVIKLFIDLMENHAAPQSEAEARMRVKEKLIEWIRPRLAGGIKPSTRLVHIIGPTGVGKTTTIAKLASEYLLHRKKKVAFLTSDTYRIAAIDQLKTYSNILNIPMEVIFSPKDLPPALSRVSHYDLILMDTAGRNYRDPVYINEMKELLTTSLPSETYLVLSLTTKFKDMKELVEEFLHLGIDHVIFTKLDETLTHGAIFNLAYHYPITLSYISNGQSVPDDLLFLTPERFADLLLGGEKS